MYSSCTGQIIPSPSPFSQSVLSLSFVHKITIFECLLLCVLSCASDSTYTTGKTPGCKGGPMEYAWWRDLFFGDSGGAIWFGDGCGNLWCHV